MRPCRRSLTSRARFSARRRTSSPARARSTSSCPTSPDRHDRQALPDVDRLAAHVDGAIDELLELSR
jgi:hypothetical protein